MGYTPDLDVTRRVDEHRNGTGNPLVKAADAHGCEILLVATWPGAGRDFERWLKDRKSTPRWCPHCQPNKPMFTPENITERFRNKPRSYEK